MHSDSIVAWARRPAFYRVLPFALFIAGLAIRGASTGVFSLDARWWYAPQAGAAALALMVFAPRYDELRAWPRSGLTIATSIAVGAAVFVLWIGADADWMRIGHPVASYVAERADGSIDWGFAALRLVGAVMIVPIVEELFWRSFFMRWLDGRGWNVRDPSTASWFAVIASSCVFALAHDRWLAGVIAGLAYAALYRRTGLLWSAVLAHACTNLLLGAWVLNGHAWMYW